MKKENWEDHKKWITEQIGKFMRKRGFIVIVNKLEFNDEEKTFILKVTIEPN